MAKQQEKKVVSKAPARKAAPAKTSPASAAKPEPRAQIDWEAVELQYRAGIRSLKDIGAEFGVSDAGILKRAKRDGWARDLKAKIKAKAEAKVSAAAVSGEVSARTKVAEAEVVEVNSTNMANVQLSHRKDIGRSRSLSMKLLDELEGQCDNPDVLNELRDIIIGPPIKGNEPADRAAERERQRLMDAFDRAMSLGSRIDSMKKLGETLKTLVGLERVAYGLADDGQNKGAGTLEDWLDSL